jgi:hypothetical protein
MAEKDDVVNPETHHEKSDVDVRALLWFVVIFIAFAIVTHVGLWIMFKFYAELARGKTNTPLTMIATPADLSVPQQPRLQPFPMKGRNGEMQSPTDATPPVDMETMRRQEEQALHKPGWIDQQKGIVRVPIDIAKRIVVQQGLPVVNQ